MADFVNDPPPVVRTVEWKLICDKANERRPDPPAYRFSNSREFAERQDPYENFPA